MNLIRGLDPIHQLFHLTALVPIFLPLIIFGIARLANSEDGDRRFLQQNGNYYNGNQYNNNGNYNNGYNNGQRYQYQNKCGWWQWDCTNYAQEQRDEEVNALPWWWLWVEDEHRDPDAVNPTLVVIYLWSVVLFIGIQVYAHNVFTGKTGYSGLVAALVVYANFAILSMLYLGGLDGGFENGEMMERNGIYGQLGMLIYMSCLCWLIYSVVFIALIRCRYSDKSESDEESTDYHKADPV